MLAGVVWEGIPHDVVDGVVLHHDIRLIPKEVARLPEPTAGIGAADPKIEHLDWTVGPPRPELLPENRRVGLIVRASLNRRRAPNADHPHRAGRLLNREF